MASFTTGGATMAVSLERRDDGQPRFPGCSNITEYTFVGKLGEGTFGEVYKAKSKKDSSVVALKKILMHHEKEGFPITAIREIKLMKALSHQNILQLREMAIERVKGDGFKKPSMYMVFPYMEHDLAGLLENPSVHFSEPQIKCYLMQLLAGLKYLHGQRILHRDMKGNGLIITLPRYELICFIAANLLISNGGILQIADFGLARPYDDAPPLPGKGGGESKREYTALVVTRWYRPPELLLQLRKYTTAIDLWGVGCVFGEMFKGKPILAGNSDLNQAQLIFNLVGTPTEENMPGWSQLPGCEGVKNFGYKRGNLSGFFQELSPTAVSLLGELLRLDWRKRINAMDALKHPYFTTPPLPAKPGDIPQFSDSHELDRKKFRSQRPPVPPVPPGVPDAPPNGAWPTSGSRGPDSRHGRVPGPGRGGRPPPPGNHANPQRRAPFPPSRDTGLPPRPPVSSNQPWDGPQSNRPDGRDDRRGQFPQSRPGGNRPTNNLDSYVPNYNDRNDRPRDSGEHGPSNPDWRGTAGRRDYRRDPPRRRSRSPSFRDGSRG
ncbi:unnamed protein product [Penicillium olsonii]|nr:unnamed protein product [Penicillium olsonii]